MTSAPRASIATILFTDLVDSTALMQRVGDERAQELFQAHHRLLKDAIEAAGGAELQWLGDGLMAAFASTAEAVRCAIAMQQGAARAGGGALAIRVGLNAGEILRQDTGSGYFGTPVVIARRLCDRAQAGQILCSSAVAALLAGRAAFRFRDLGPAELKGIPASTGICEVGYEAEPTTGALVQTPFVGRREEVAKLLGALAQARAGRGALWMVVGEPGIGKTRTLEEFAARARDAGAAVLWGRCFEGDFAPPYGPFAEALGDHARGAAREELEKDLGRYASVLARLAPALRELFPNLEEPAPLQPDEERFRLLDAVVQFLSKATERGPLVLVLDDLHWADRGSIAMLRHVARFVRRLPLLVVGAYRDVELDRQHPLADALGALRREAAYERILLRGLAPPEVAELLATLAARDVPEALVRAIERETDGNPFFIREVLLHLVEEGRLHREEGRWTTAFSVEQLGIPEGVRQVIGRRLSRLSDDANRLLAAASGFLGSFRLSVAARAAELEEPAALDALDEVLDAQLARPTGEPDAYDFTHALIRHTLYSEQNASRQVRLHRRIARAMESFFGDRAAEHAGEIAQQYHRSAALPDVERGVPHCLAAATRAEGAAAHEEAAAYLRMALELMPADDARRPRVLGRLALALAWSRSFEEAERVAHEAGDLLAATEGRDAAADYLADAAKSLWAAGFTSRAWSLAEQGLRYAGTRRDLTWALLADLDLRRREATDSANVGTPLDTAVRAAITRVVLATPRWWEKEGIPPPSFASRAEILAQPHVFSFALVYQVGEYRRAVEAAEDLAERQVTRGAFALAALELENAARALIAVGEVGRAEERHARAFALADRIGAPAFVTAQLLGSIFERARLRGEGYAELFASTQVLRDDPGLENRWLRAAIMAATAYGAAELGQPELALAQIEQVMPAIEQRTGQMNNYTFIVFWTSAALWELEEPRFAGRIEPNLLEKTIKPDFRYVSTDARLAMAWLCALQGRPDEAREWFAKARVVLGEQGARPLRAITDFEEARMHARLGSRGDRAHGLALLDAADPEFAAIGMPGWLRRSQELRQLLDRT